MNINTIKIGDKASIKKFISDEDVKSFAEISGDKNPIHLNEEYAKNTIFKSRIAHGILVAGLISAVIADKLPGKGSIYLSQSLRFLKPVMIGDEITAEVEVLNINKNIITLRTKCFNQNSIDVISGEAEIMMFRGDNECQ